MQNLELQIEGMTCIACSNAIQRSLSKKEFIKNVNVNLITKKALISYDDNFGSQEIEEKIIKQIEKMGFNARRINPFLPPNLDSNSPSLDSNPSLNTPPNLDSNPLFKNNFILALVFAIPLFLLSMWNMLFPFFAFTKNAFSAFLEFALLIPILISGKGIYKKGFKGLVNFTPNMDSLVMMGSLGAIIYSFYEILNSRFDLYFESAGVIISVILLGKKIEERAFLSLKDSLLDIASLVPKKMIKLINRVQIEVNIDEIKKGDILVIPKGAMSGVDGILLDNECLVDESIITGESKHKRKAKNETILSGSINLGEQFSLEAISSKSTSMIGKIIELMNDVKKTKIERIANRVSFYFVPFVIILAIFSGGIWFYLENDLHLSFIVISSILLISCPCALGLATPLCILISNSKAAKKGIYFKNALSIENASKINTVIFDKTGTLTKGELEVLDSFVIEKYKKEYVFSLIKALEIKSEHLIAKAILKYLKNYKLENFEISEISTKVGLGLEGVIDNKKIKIGSSRFINHSIQSPHLISYISIDGEYVGHFVIADALRENIPLLIKNLESNNINCVILSGDSNIKSVESVAKMCGIKEYYHSMLPNEKLDFITNAKKQNKFIAFIGDGVNDALALKKADIGISLKTANDIAIKNADIIILNDNLNSVYESILISKRAIRSIKENLLFAFIYNFFAIPLAALGILNPMISSVAMGLSSLSVVANSLRLKISKDIKEG